MAVWLFAGASFRAAAVPVLPAWTPIFKGVDRLVATNRPDGGNYPHLMVANAVRVDLTDPDLRLSTTPRIANYEQNVRETGGMTVSRFLQTQRVQVAINGNFFNPQDYYLPEGTPMTLDGLAIHQGVIVSPASATSAAVIAFDVTNHATIIHTNSPSASNAGRYNALAGQYPLIYKGKNLGRQYAIVSGGIHDVNPRTAYGLSQDGNYFYILTVDGRQPGYSDGSYDYETAGWLLLLGAYDAVNMDGGGSTTLVMADAAGNPMALNSSSAVADSGMERTVGSHLGIVAKPLPGFITNLVALPDDTAATITWSTPAPATTQLAYGTNSSLGLTTPVQTSLTTNHAVLLTNLTPGTGYFYQAVALANGASYVSPQFYFTTSNYVTTNAVLVVTNSWKYTSANLDGVGWTAPGYSDAAWSGAGPGLLWVDVRNPPDPGGVTPENTQMPADPATGYPAVTYYFRAHFPVNGSPSGAAIALTGYIDDGAVVYLNGGEISRLRMADAPAPIVNSTLAIAYPCNGDATCLDVFAVEANAASLLVAGDNVVAVEVHNYNALSPDITFGLEFDLVESAPVNPVLSIGGNGSVPTLSWTRGGFTLQQSASPAGPFTDVPGPVFSSPFTPTDYGQSRFYRLRK